MLLKNGLIFIEGESIEGDLRITGDRISEIGFNLEPEDGDRVIDLEGLWIWPGVIDGHVHFRDPGATYKEDWESGSKAAVSGGVTTVFDMPNTKPETTTKKALLEKRACAHEASYCNFGLFFGATTSNLEEANEVAEQVPGLKIFMGCSTGDLLVHERKDLEPIFRDYQGLICVHAESEKRLHELAEVHKNQIDRDDCDPAIHSVIRDNEAAREAVALACELAVEYEQPLHILHLSTKEELDEIKKVLDEDPEFPITCEVCPHHLFLDTNDYEECGTLVRMNPPLRSSEDVEAMWEALKDSYIQMVATDHAPHTLEEKLRPYKDAPSGVPGVETLLPIMLDAADRGLCDYFDVVDWLCHNPASVYGIADRGYIIEGFYADLVIIDPQVITTIRNEKQYTKCKWTPWHGRDISGAPVMTIVNGKIVFKRDEDGREKHFFHKGNARDVFADE